MEGKESGEEPGELLDSVAPDADNAEGFPIEEVHFQVLTQRRHSEPNPRNKFVAGEAETGLLHQVSPDGVAKTSEAPDEHHEERVEGGDIGAILQGFAPKEALLPHFRKVQRSFENQKETDADHRFAQVKHTHS